MLLTDNDIKGELEIRWVEIDTITMFIMVIYIMIWSYIASLKYTYSNRIYERNRYFHVFMARYIFITPYYWRLHSIIMTVNIVRLFLRSLIHSANVSSVPMLCPLIYMIYEILLNWYIKTTMGERKCGPYTHDVFICTFNNMESILLGTCIMWSL